jgi:hypothetical protein
MHPAFGTRNQHESAKPKQDALASENTAFTVTISGNAPLMPQSLRRLYRAQGNPAASTYLKKSASQGRIDQFYQKLGQISWNCGKSPLTAPPASQYSRKKQR